MLHLAPAQDQEADNNRPKTPGGFNGSRACEPERKKLSGSGRLRVRHTELIADHDALKLEHQKVLQQRDAGRRVRQSIIDVNDALKVELAELESHLDVVLAENRRLVTAVKARPQAGWKQQALKMIALLHTNPNREQAAAQMQYDLACVTFELTKSGATK
jgi:hypothetical protein